MNEPSIACVYVPALPLQLLLARCGKPSGQAVAVVQASLGSSAPIGPQAKLLMVNSVAQRAGIVRGMALSEAQGLCHSLHAEAVAAQDIEAAVKLIWQALLQFSPAVESDKSRPGLVWLDPTGLRQLFVDLTQWGRGIHAKLKSMHLYASVVVGYQRYFCYALATQRRPYCITPSPQVERHAACAVSLQQLELPSQLSSALAALGITRLGEFLQLSPAEVRQRFGAEAGRVHRAVQGGGVSVPLQPHHVPELLQAELEIDPPVSDAERLLFVVKTMLQPFQKRLSAAGEHIARLKLCLRITAQLTQEVHIEPAAPTLEDRVLSELLRLRLGATKLFGPVEHITLALNSARVRPEQCIMLQQKPRRDLHAAAAALAKLRALFGDASTSVARLSDSYLPEESFAWVSVTQLPPPTATEAKSPPLVRQIFIQPKPLPTARQHGPSLCLGRDFGTISAMHGPFRLDTHWWRGGCGRDYYYVETHLQHILWIYLQKAQRRWFLQGQVD